MCCWRGWTWMGRCGEIDAPTAQAPVGDRISGQRSKFDTAYCWSSRARFFVVATSGPNPPGLLSAPNQLGHSGWPINRGAAAQQAMTWGAAGPPTLSLRGFLEPAIRFPHLPPVSTPGGLDHNSSSLWKSWPHFHILLPRDLCSLLPLSLGVSSVTRFRRTDPIN